MKLRGRCINPGKAEGEAIVTHFSFSFKGEIDPHTGMIPSPTHEHFGRSLKDKILVCHSGKGSSENTNVAYEAKSAGVAPAGIVVQKIEPVLGACVLIADIPTLEVNQDAFELIKTGDHVRMDAQEGYLEILK